MIAYLFILIEWGSRLLSEADIVIHHSNNIFTLAHTESSLSHLNRRLLPCPLAQPTYPKPLVGVNEKTMRFTDSQSEPPLTVCPIVTLLRHLKTLLTTLNNHSQYKTVYKRPVRPMVKNKNKLENHKYQDQLLLLLLSLSLLLLHFHITITVSFALPDW